MASVSTFGFGGPELQAILFERIRETFEINISPDSTCVRSGGSLEAAGQEMVRLGRRVAWKAMLELEWDRFKRLLFMGRVVF